MAKPGRLGNEEMDYIRNNAYKMSAADIGTAIGRSEAVVERFITNNIPPPPSTTGEKDPEADRVTIRQELRNSEAWKNLKLELFAEELKFFEEVYLAMMAQMRDVLATEETQVFHVAKYEVMMSRNLKDRKLQLEDIRHLEQMQRDLVAKFKGDISRMSEADRDYALQLETKLSMARANEKTLTAEYAKLQEQHSGLLKSLKSTRDQRIKQIETEGKNGFLSIIKDLTRRDEQIRQGRQIELVKMAGEKEYLRLGRPTKYEDGSMDNPILSADTVDLGPEDDDGKDDDGAAD